MTERPDEAYPTSIRRDGTLMSTRSRSNRRRTTLLAGILAAGAPRAAVAKTVNIDTTGDLPAAVAALAAGDELVLAGGTYSLSSRFSIGVTGASGAPIVIRSKDGETAVITRPDANQNDVNIEGAAY